jgi:hypothetical protein
MEIELVRGTRRRKHVEAVLMGDRLRVSFPRWMSLREADEIAHELADRMRRRVDPSHIDVAARARRLAREYDLPRARVVRWSDQQVSRWGSCTPEDAAIRRGSSTTCSSTSSRTSRLRTTGPTTTRSSTGTRWPSGPAAS